MLRDFVNIGPRCIEFAFKNDFIARLTDFYLESESPIKCYGEKKHKISGSKYSHPNFDPLF